MNYYKNITDGNGKYISYYTKFDTEDMINT